MHVHGLCGRSGGILASLQTLSYTVQVCKCNKAICCCVPSQVTRCWVAPLMCKHARNASEWHELWVVVHAHDMASLQTLSYTAQVCKCAKGYNTIVLMFGLGFLLQVTRC